MSKQGSRNTRDRTQMQVPEAELVQFSGIYTKRYKSLWDGEAGRGQNQENMEQARIKN